MVCRPPRQGIAQQGQIICPPKQGIAQQGQKISDRSNTQFTQTLAVTARLPAFQTPGHDGLSPTPTRYSTAGSDGTQTPTRYSTAGSIKQFTSDLEFAQNLMIFHYHENLAEPFEKIIGNHSTPRGYQHTRSNSKLNRNLFSESDFYAPYESFDHTTKH